MGSVTGSSLIKDPTGCVTRKQDTGRTDGQINRRTEG